MDRKTLLFCIVLLACVIFNTESLKTNHLRNQFNERMHKKFNKLFHNQESTITVGD
jgi:hypothetical protein